MGCARRMFMRFESGERAAFLASTLSPFYRTGAARKNVTAHSHTGDILH
jgi:hypothetical protein